MAERITTAAAEIATALATLPDIKRAYPFPKSGGLEYGDLCLAIGLLGEAQTFGERTTQEVVWDCIVRLGGAATTGKPQQVQEAIARLGSEDPGQGISGLLRSQQFSQSLKQYGSPRVTDDGLEVEYGVEEDTGAITTLISCRIMATVTNT